MFRLPDVPVIALSKLVVVPEDASPIDHERQPVFESVPAARRSLAEPPYDQLHEGVRGDDMTLVERQGGLHVGDNTNTRNAGQAASGLPGSAAGKAIRQDSKSLTPPFTRRFFYPPVYSFGMTRVNVVDAMA